MKKRKKRKRKERRVGTNKIIYALISHLGECDGAKMVCVGFTSVCSERCIAFLKTVFFSRKISLGLDFEILNPGFVILIIHTLVDFI